MKPNHRLVCLALLGALALNAAAVTRYVDLNSPSPTPPYTNWLTAATNIQDAIDAAVAGDTVLVTNGVYASGGRIAHGTLTNRIAVTIPLTVRSVNGPSVTVIQGYQVPATTNGVDAIRGAYLTNDSTLDGFTVRLGATTATGVNLVTDYGGGVWAESTNVLITNCLIQMNSARQAGGGVSGGMIKNCVLISNTVSSLSPSGISFGGGAYQSALDGCLLAWNFAETGGGAYLSSLSDSLIASNSARIAGGGTGRGSLTRCFISNNSASFGGGIYASVLLNCVISSNTASGDGGGGYSDGYPGSSGGGTNCLIIGNSSTSSSSSASGGGAKSGRWRNCTFYGNRSILKGGGVDLPISIRNCIIIGNEALISSNYSGAFPEFCCTIPLPALGNGNIMTNPAFVDPTSGDYRLQSNSPCINAGVNLAGLAGVDLAGNSRISGGTVDIGAYEFQSPSSVLSYAWAQQNGLPTDGSADFTDADADGANNWQEWRADTSPTNAASALLMGTATNGVTGLVVSWASVATRNYWLERATNFVGLPPFQTIATNLPGVAGVKTYNDTSATNGGPYFYRVGVQ